MRTGFECVRSRRGVDCGPAALATVARHYGLHTSVSRLEDMVSTDLQGTSSRGLRTAAEKLGFLAALGKAKPGALDEVPLPAIAHFNDTAAGHFVVVHKVGSKSVTVADPSRGVVTLPREEFLSRWSRTILLLKPSADFRKNEKDPSPIVGVLRVASGERGLLGYSLICALIMLVMGFSGSFFVQVVIDRVIPHSNTGLLRLALLVFLLVLFFRSFYGLVRQYLLAYVGFRVEMKMGLGYVSHVLSLPITFFDRRCTGDVFSRLSDVTSVQAAIVGSLLSVFTDLILIASLTTLMAWYSIKLTLIALCFLPLIAAVTVVINRPLVAKQRELRERSSQVANRFIEAIGSMRILKVFTAERVAYEKVEEQFIRLQQVALRRAILSSLLSASSTLLTGAATLTLLYVGALSVIEGRLSVGQLMFFFSTLGFFLGPVDRLANSMAILQEAVIGMERISEVRLVESEGAAQSHRTREVSLLGEVEFQDVSFCYREGYPVLSEVSLTMRRGQMIAVVGETGSGKTSLASLITGLYSPTSGRILIDGFDVQDLDTEALRGGIGVVFQDPSLVSGTVFDNIALGRPNASLDEVRVAARLAKADDFIMALPKRYDYEVGDRGLALSSGQRQRIAIARALLRSPAILILDEATGNLDAETEHEVFKNIRASRPDRTTVIITHRLNIALKADVIAVLDKGRLVELGTHQELIEVGARYYALWSSQWPTGPPNKGQRRGQLPSPCECHNLGGRTRDASIFSERGGAS